MNHKRSLRAGRACSFPTWALLCGGALLAGSCGGGAERQSRILLTPAQAAEVSYRTGSNRFTLRSAAAIDDAAYKKGGLYGSQVSPDVKFADQRTMQALIDALDELGHFDRATAQARADARVAIVVSVGDQQTVWSQPGLQPENMAELERFNTAGMAILQVHNNIISYHASDMSASDFDRALDEQNAKNNDAVQNILQKTRGQGR